MTKKKDIDSHSGTETTGHEWDGIKELNTPLPRWWLWIFYASIAWSIGYWVAMPAWPLISGYTAGILGYSQRAEVIASLADLNAGRQDMAKRLLDWTPGAGPKDDELRDFAFAMGKAAFGDNCATCHGSGAPGFKGYPNLNDDIWLWGGTIADIEKTLVVGIRSTHPETRNSKMPAYGKDGLLKPEEINGLTELVLKLSGQAHDPTAAASVEAIFKEQCAQCHAETGKGLREFGGPNLTDAEWLYGGSREAIRTQIINGRAGVMPSWSGRLDPATIKALAVYVHSLGGGE